MTDNTSLIQSNTSISGGVTLDAGRIDIGGDVVGRDKIVNTTVITGDQQYDVRGLANPYLGLQSFTYAERAKFAGREKLIAETVTRLTAPDDPIALLFVTGASGSGKSSFVQAGLLPALEQHYAALSVKWAVFRPARDPLAALADALWRQLGLPPFDAATDLGNFLTAHTPPQQVNVIVIDQFEELFTQSAAQSRDALFNLLTHLSPFRSTRTHLMATLRADYLPELFALPVLYDIAKRGVDLWAMSVDELGEAIQRPLRIAYPDHDKRFQTELIERLAQDAAEDPAYLPLLQVTLEEIWRKGSLTVGAYANLADAIEQRADKVLAYRDYDAAQPQQSRPAAEQTAILDLCLNLVDVSLDDQVRRDVRRRRALDELSHGVPERAQLIDALTQARLFSVDAETDNPTHVEVDLIHETLLTNWDRLRQAIAEQRHHLRQRARFEQQLKEWLGQNRSDDYLLNGVRLAEARELARRDDIALRSTEAQDFVQRSVAREEARRQKELDDARKLAEAERLRAEEQSRSALQLRRRAVYLVGALVIALGLGIAAGLFGIQSRQLATQNASIASTAQADADRATKSERVAHARQLIAQSQLAFEDHPLLGVRLGLEALTLVPSDDVATRDSIVRIITEQAKSGRSSKVDRNVALYGPGDIQSSYLMIYRPDPHELRRTIDGERVITISQPIQDWSFSGGIDPRYLWITYQSGVQEVRRTIDGSLAFSLTNQRSNSPGFSPDREATFYLDTGDSDTGIRRLHWSASGTPVFTPTHQLSYGVDYILATQPTMFIVRYEDAPDELRRMSDGSLMATLPYSFTNVSIGPGKSPAFFFLSDNNLSINPSPSQLRRLSDGQLVETLPGSIHQLYFSPDPAARFFVISYWGAPAEVRHTVDGSLAMTLTEDAIYAVIFDSNPAAAYFGIQYGTWSELRRMSDGRPAATLDHQLTQLSFSADPTASYFVLGNAIPQNGELRRVSDASLVEELPGNVHAAYFSLDPGLPYFVITYTNRTAEIRRVSDGAVVDKTAAGDYPYFSPLPGAAFFIIGLEQPYIVGAPHSELRSAVTGQVIEQLPDTIEEVLFPDPNVPYFIIRYASRPAELRQALTGQLIEKLPGALVGGNNTGKIGTCTIGAVCQSGPYLWLPFQDGHSELWKWQPVPHRIADLGTGVDGKTFDPGNRQVFVQYGDGRAYFLDLDWLSALNDQTATGSVDDLVRLSCQASAANHFDEATLKPDLGDQAPQACQKQP